MIRKISYEEMPICNSEILRYSGVKNYNEELEDILNSVVSLARKDLKYSICYDEFNVKIEDNICDFTSFKVLSKALAKNLSGCDRVIIFAASVGSKIDRLIAKYGSISPTKALFLQGFGAERIEALCDCFCEDVSKTYDRKLKPRFSPGYGDVPLEMQSDIFRVLNPEKQIGLCLNDSLLMSPSKSVTAIVGITNQKYEENEKVNKCRSCSKKDCEFRETV